MIAAPLQGLVAAIPVQAAWTVGRAFRIACAARHRADRCSPTVEMTCGWRRLDNRTEPVAARSMMLELPGRLVILAMLQIAMFEIAMFEAGSMLAQHDHRGRSPRARHPARSNREPAS